jgi:hypothetical protein
MAAAFNARSKIEAHLIQRASPLMTAPGLSYAAIRHGLLPPFAPFADRVLIRRHKLPRIDASKSRAEGAAKA